MIKINLLPQELVPKKRNFVPHIVIAAVAVVLVISYLGSLSGTLAERVTKRRDLKTLQEDLAKLDDVVAQVKQLEAEKQLSSQKEQAVAQITAGRTLWSHELYVLASLVPEEIWLEKVNISSRKRPVTVEVPNPNRSAGQPPTIKKTMVQSFPALSISGFALSPHREKGLALVGAFIRNMKMDDVFSLRMVAPEMRSVERLEHGGETVMKFLVDCEISQ